MPTPPGPAPTDADEAPATAAEVVAGLDLATKVRLLSGRGFWVLEAIPQAGLSGIVVADGPHGVRCQEGAADHLGLGPAHAATCFPPAVLLGSTWDEALAHELGVALGEEARALGVSVVLGPGVNIKRHPAGGRCFEYYSEDPFLTGRLATANVRGIQSTGVGASLKHFAVNNQESHRMVVDVVVDERTRREIYLPAFEMVVTEAQPWTVMCAYNQVGGVYASDDHGLLTGVLRDEWGFEGLVVSDWGAVNDRVAGIRAGMDLEMPGSEGAFDAEVLAAVAAGRLSEDDVDRCAERVVALLQRGQQTGPPPTADHDAHHRLARRAAAAGSVLLVNDGVLPLRPDGRIAVVGAFATSPRYQGAGSSQVTPTRLDRALDELVGRVGDTATVSFAEGYDPRTGRSGAGQLDRALAVARDADVVVCFAGLPAPAESEGFDRTTLDLPDDHVRLIEALAAQSAPVVVVLHNGGVVHMPWADRVAAVLECWLGGQAGGGAVVDVLFGDAEPGGRLAESIPHHIAQVPADTCFPGEARQVVYREGPFVGYRFHDTAGVPARFAFGAGLSYTTFAWTDVRVEGEGTDLVVHATVANTGDRAGSDVVQVYVRDVEASIPRPHQELKGFAKVHLAPGESTSVAIALDRRSFAVWDVAAHDWLVEAGTFEVVVARSSVDPVEVIAVEVASDDVLAPEARPVARAASDDEMAALLGRPIPTPKPSRPFDRTSTLEDVEATALGRLLGRIVEHEGMKRAAEEFPNPDEATKKMVRSALREGPIRALATMSGGVMTLAQVDALIELFEHGPVRAARGLPALLRDALDRRR